MSPSLLEGRLVRLRAREPEDASPSYAWTNDFEVTRNIKIRYPQSHKSQRDWAVATSGPHYASGLFSIETLASPQMIGTCGLRAGQPEDRCATLAIWIGDKVFWNGGYGTDAMIILCRFGFEIMNLHRIELDVYADNPRAQHVYEKLGFVVEGRKRDHDFRAGQYRDTVMMGLLPGELRDPRGEVDDKPV
jgi:RimJ/RimL family protein N-acetyltransferase